MAHRIGASTSEPFFLQKKTLDALDRLAGCDELVIYCGAGVTIDRTGVSWIQLIRSIFDISRVRSQKVKTRLKSLEFLLATITDPRQAASLVAEEFGRTGTSENEFLTSKLYEVLYAHGGWSTGLILRNIARLAIVATLLERKVTIITTNYDSFIEVAIEKRLGDLLRDGRLQADWEPGRFRTTLTEGSEPVRKEIAPARGGASDIDIVYLHGRVDPHNEPTEGDLVLTEVAFARTREQSLRALGQHLKAEREGNTHGLLVVGASLNDGPLIDALGLAAARTHRAGGTRGQVRMALVDNPLSRQSLQSEFKSEYKSVKIDADDVLGALALRGKHLGVEILWPASHSQSAQFFEELRVNMSARARFDDDSAYRSKRFGVSYVERLDRWWAEFQTSRTAVDPNFVHERLRFVKTALAQILEDHGLVEKETLRLELWARIRPSKTNRRLTLIGNSSGPLIEERTWRTEPLSSTTNASVHAYAEGRPLRTSVEEFGLPSSDAHWQTFFSVPIFVHVEADNDTGGGLLPVGVITLASNLSTEARLAEDLSVLAKVSPEVYEEMKVLIIYAGRTLLNPALANFDPAAEEIEN